MVTIRYFGFRKGVGREREHFDQLSLPPPSHITKSVESLGLLLNEVYFYGRGIEVFKKKHRTPFKIL